MCVCAWQRRGESTTTTPTVFALNFMFMNLTCVFKEDGGNTMYTGTRSGSILKHDLRSRSTLPICLMNHPLSVCCLRLSPDEHYMYASDFSGKVCMSYHLLPVSVQSTFSTFWHQLIWSRTVNKWRKWQTVTRLSCLYIFVFLVYFNFLQLGMPSSSLNDF